MAETGVALYLAAHGWPYAERRTLAGAKDKGDISGTPKLCWEVKYTSAKFTFGQWLNETEVETLNAGADHGILVVKPPGVGSTRVGKWYAVMRSVQFAQLLDDAGHPEQVNPLRSRPRLEISAPIRHHPGSLPVQMPLQGNKFFALTTVPPGCSDSPDRHYKIMYLEQMVLLLRRAGYGDVR